MPRVSAGTLIYKYFCSILQSIIVISNNQSIIMVIYYRSIMVIYYRSIMIIYFKSYMTCYNCIGYSITIKIIFKYNKNHNDILFRSSDIFDDDHVKHFIFLFESSKT